MADQEVSKIMWIAIVVALAASVFVIAKPQINALADQAFKNIEEVVKGDDAKPNPDPDPDPDPDPEPEDKDLVNPTETLTAQTSAPGASDAVVNPRITLQDTDGNSVECTATIKDSNDKVVKNGELSAGEYTIVYEAEGYKPATQKLVVTDPEAKPDLVAPADKTLTTPGFKQSVDGGIPATIKDSKGNDVTVDVTITGGSTTNPKALTKGTYTVTYSATDYKSVTNTITVTDKMVTPSGLTKTISGGGKNPVQVISGKASPNSQVEIKYGVPNGSTIDYSTVTTTVDSSGNFEYQLGQFEVPGNITKISARSIYEYSSTDKQMSGWAAEVNV